MACPSRYSSGSLPRSFRLAPFPRFHTILRLHLSQTHWDGVQRAPGTRNTAPTITNKHAVAHAPALPPTCAPSVKESAFPSAGSCKGPPPLPLLTGWLEILGSPTILQNPPACSGPATRVTLSSGKLGPRNGKGLLIPQIAPQRKDSKRTKR